MNTNKKVVRLTESQLHNIIAESVEKILKEYGETEKGQAMLGRLAGRHMSRKDGGDKFREINQYASDKRKNMPINKRMNTANIFDDFADAQARHDSFDNGTNDEFGHSNSQKDYIQLSQRNKMRNWSKFGYNS